MMRYTARSDLHFTPTQQNPIIATSLGSVCPFCNYRANTIGSHNSTDYYSQVLIDTGVLSDATFRRMELSTHRYGSKTIV